MTRDDDDDAGVAVGIVGVLPYLRCGPTRCGGEWRP
jgi:hypothetical protein